MAKKEKIYMPSGSGGLLRYGEEGETVFRLKPEQVAYIVAGVIVVELVLKFFF